MRDTGTAIARRLGRIEDAALSACVYAFLVLALPVVVLTRGHEGRERSETSEPAGGERSSRGR